MVLNLKKVADILSSNGSFGNASKEEINLKQENLVPICPESEDEKGKSRMLDSVVPTNVGNGIGRARLLENDGIGTGEVKSENASAIDDMMSSIIAEPISDKDILESVLNAEHDPIVELASIGAVVRKPLQKTPVKQVFPTILGAKLLESQRHDDVFYDKIIAHIQTPITAATLSSVGPGSIKPPAKTTGFIVKEEISGTIENLHGHHASLHGAHVDQKQDKNAELVSFYNKSAPQPTAMYVKEVLFKPLPNSGERTAFNFAPPKKKNFSKWFFVVLAVVGVFTYGLTLKHELVSDGSMALDNIKKAQADLEHFDFSGAAVSFQKSYDDFTKASQNLNMVGVGLASIIGDIPGLGQVKSAKNIVEAGKLLSLSGKAMSEALAALAQTGAVLDPSSVGKIKPAKIISQLKTAIDLSSLNFDKAKALISDVDESALPKDKQVAFHDFKDKMPFFEKTLADSQGYVDFLEGVVGISEHKKYLLLFQNNSELRPTGGFPGTYGVISLSNGGLENFFVDDVYNLDGQLKKNIIPPKQLQHITPTWGMRDSAWFIDFPDSARKAMSFFAEEAGYEVNGVITLNPDIIKGILSVVGPIKMPEYGLTLTADNFLENIQDEVEYGPNRVQPKKVITDFAPRLLEKLYSADAGKWMEIFKVFMTGLDEKAILLYFNDKELENFAIETGFGGEVKKVADDYLTVNLTNVKGSKTDAVTDTSVAVDSRLENGPGRAGQVIHKVTLTRAHNGGGERHGFYNRQNPTYVRVLIPENAELLGVSGNDVPNFKPLVTYNGISFEKDKELERYEGGFSFNKLLGVDRFEESGLTGQVKQGIGFWMVIDPGTTKKVEFEYSVPLPQGGTSYSFYYQKQPGLDFKNFKFTFNNAGDKQIISTMPELNRIGNTYVFDGELKKDMEIKINTK